MKFLAWRSTWVLAGLALFVVLLGVRSVAFGLEVEERSRFGIGGADAAWSELSDVLLLLAPLTAFAALAAVAALWIPKARRRALFGLTFVCVANVGTYVAKRAAAWLLPDGRGTLPSGHTTLALTAAAVIVLLTPGRWRIIGLPLAGFVGALGPLGVIAALWHTPCDPPAALALMPLSVWLALYVTQVLLGQRRAAPGSVPSVRRLPPPRHLAPGADVPTWLLIGGGAATLAVMLRGWGFRPAHSSLGNHLLGLGEFVALPCLAAVVLLEVARVGEELGSPKH